MRRCELENPILIISNVSFTSFLLRIFFVTIRYLAVDLFCLLEASTTFVTMSTIFRVKFCTPEVCQKLVLDFVDLVKSTFFPQMTFLQIAPPLKKDSAVKWAFATAEICK